MILYRVYFLKTSVTVCNIAYLVSDGASYITSEVINVGGKEECNHK